MAESLVYAGNIKKDKKRKREIYLKSFVVKSKYNSILFIVVLLPVPEPGGARPHGL